MTLPDSCSCAFCGCCEEEEEEEEEVPGVDSVVDVADGLKKVFSTSIVSVKRTLCESVEPVEEVLTTRLWCIE